MREKQKTAPAAVRSVEPSVHDEATPKGKDKVPQDARGKARSRKRLTRLHIQGFHKEEEVAMFRKQLQKFGPVENVDIPNNKLSWDGQPRFAGFAYFDVAFDDDAKLTRCQNAYNNAKWRSLTLKISRAKPHYTERLKKEWKQVGIREKRIEYKHRKHDKKFQPLSQLSEEELAAREGWSAGRYGRAMPTLRIRKPYGRFFLVEARTATPRLYKFKHDKREEAAQEALASQLDSSAAAINGTTSNTATTAGEAISKKQKKQKKQTKSQSSRTKTIGEAAALERKINKLFDDGDSSDSDSSDSSDGEEKPYDPFAASDADDHDDDHDEEQVDAEEEEDEDDQNDNDGDIFDDDDDGEKTSTVNNPQAALHAPDKARLKTASTAFWSDSNDDSDSNASDAGAAESDDDIDAIESAFAPRVGTDKAEKLVKAQMRVGADARFQLTEDFLDDEDEGEEDEDSKAGANIEYSEDAANPADGHDEDDVSVRISDETRKQLQLLAKLTGRPIASDNAGEVDKHGRRGSLASTSPNALPSKSTSASSAPLAAVGKPGPAKGAVEKNALNEWGLQSVKRFDPTAKGSATMLVKEAGDEQEAKARPDVEIKGSESQKGDADADRTSIKSSERSASIADEDLDSMYEEKQLDSDAESDRSNEKHNKDADSDSVDGGDEASKGKATFVRASGDWKTQLKPASGNWRDTKSISTFSFGFGGLGSSQTEAPASDAHATEDEGSLPLKRAKKASAADESGESPVSEVVVKPGPVSMSTSVTATTSAAPTRNVLKSIMGSSARGKAGAGRAVSYFFLSSDEMKGILNDKRRCFMRKQSLAEVEKEWEETRESKYSDIKEQQRQARKRKKKSRMRA